MDEMGCEFILETTAHGGARPSHAEWQGRRFHRGGAVDYKGRHYPDFEAATGYGTGAGLCGWNCRHTFSRCSRSWATPAPMDAGAAAGAERPEHRVERQKVHRLRDLPRCSVPERNVRRWKKRYLAEDAAGLDPPTALCA